MALLALARLLVIALAYAHKALLVHTAVLLLNVERETARGSALLIDAIVLLHH